MTTIDGSGNVNGSDGSYYDVDDAPVDDSPPLPCMPPPADMPPAGDIGAEFAALVIVNADQNKAAARQLQKSEEAMQTVDQKREINAMHREAELQMAAGIVDVVANTCDAVASACSAGGATGTGKGLGDFAGASKGASGMLTAEAKFKAADAKDFDMQAEAAKRGAQASKDIVDDSKKLADKAIDFYQQWVQGNTSVMQAALHRA